MNQNAHESNYGPPPYADCANFGNPPFMPTNGVAFPQQPMQLHQYSNPYANYAYMGNPSPMPTNGVAIPQQPIQLSQYSNQHGSSQWNGQHSGVIGPPQGHLIHINNVTPPESENFTFRTFVKYCGYFMGIVILVILILAVINSFLKQKYKLETFKIAFQDEKSK
jgi:hypothetical protein